MNSQFVSSGCNIKIIFVRQTGYYGIKVLNFIRETLHVCHISCHDRKGQLIFCMDVRAYYLKSCFIKQGSDKTSHFSQSQNNVGFNFHMRVFLIFDILEAAKGTAAETGFLEIENMPVKGEILFQPRRVFFYVEMFSTIGYN